MPVSDEAYAEAVRKMERLEFELKCEREHPTLVVCAAIIHDGRILLTQRNQPELKAAHMKWQLPGGKVEFGEAPQIALMREMKEELGIDGYTRELINYPPISTVWTQRGTPDRHTIVIGYHFSPHKQEGTFEHTDNSIADYRWAAGAHLGVIQFLPGNRELADRALLDALASPGASRLDA